MHGNGLQVWDDGDKYEGEYIEGIKNGFGKMTWEDGSYYEG